MAEIKQTKRAATVLKETVDCCKEYRHEFIMPEHLLMVLIDEFSFGHIFNKNWKRNSKRPKWCQRARPTSPRYRHSWDG